MARLYSCLATDKIGASIEYVFGIRVLIYRDLHDRVVDGEGWSDSHTEWTKAHLLITQADQTNVENQKFR